MKQAPARLLRLLSLLALPTLFSGCGGGEEERPEPQVAEPPAVAAPVAPPPKAQEPEVAKKLEPPPPPPPEQPQRPEDVSQWKVDDFRTARSEGDPKLAEAVKALGERSIGDASAVALLVELLEKPKEDAAAAAAPNPGVPRRPNPRGNRAVSAEVVTAAIRALGRNATPDADQALERLLAGKINTEAQQRTIGEGVLTTLVENLSREHGELLLSVAFTPEKFFATATAGQDEAERNGLQLRSNVLAKIRDVAGLELRTRIAERMWNEPLSPEERKPFLEMLLVPRGENVPAQIVLMRQAELDDATKFQLLSLMSQLASGSISRLLGIPEDLRIQAPPGYRRTGNRGGNASRQFRIGDPKLPPGFTFNSSPSSEPPAGEPQRRLNRAERGSRNQAADPAAPYELARRLWTAEFLQSLLTPAKQVERLDQILPPALIAAAIPQHQSRAELARLNKGMWDEGTKDLPLGNLFGEYVYDPGLLLVVKQVPRKEDPVRLEARKGTPEPRRNTQRGRQRSTRPAVNEKEIPRYEWMQASEEFVYVLNQRFHAAALAQSSGAPSQEPLATKSEQAPPTSQEPAAGGPAAAKASKKATQTDSSAKAAEDGALDHPSDDVFGTRSKARAAPSADGSELPVELHDGAKVVAEYHLDWPTDLGDKLAGVEVSPLVIHYVRIEEPNRIGKLMTHYQKFIKGAKLRYLDKGRWIDHVDDGTAPGRRRSVDVMIRSDEAAAGAGNNAPPAGKAAERPKNPEEPLVVEILSIEIPDPLPEPASAAEGTKPATASNSPRDEESGGR